MQVDEGDEILRDRMQVACLGAGRRPHDWGGRLRWRSLRLEGETEARRSEVNPVRRLSH